MCMCVLFLGRHFEVIANISYTKNISTNMYLYKYHCKVIKLILLK